MRKFLMAAAVLAVAACGGKKEDAGLATTPTSVQDSTAKADSIKRAMVRDSVVKDSIRVADSVRVADSIAKAKKKP